MKKKKLPTEEQSRRGRGNRNKGKVYERKIANFYKELGFPAKRTIQSRQGYEGCDVQGTPWWVECKHTKSIGVVLDWWQQTKSDILKGRAKSIIDSHTLPPHSVLHIRENGADDLVVISLAHWKELVQNGQHLSRLSKEL